MTAVASLSTGEIGARKTFGIEPSDHFRGAHNVVLRASAARSWTVVGGGI